MATSHLDALYETLSDPLRAKFLTQAHVYPTPQFPRSAEYIIEQLLRKRQQPAVADWTARGLAMGLSLEQEEPEHQGDAQKVDWEELWEWAGPASSGIASAVFPEFMNEEEAVVVKKGKEVAADKSGPMLPIENVLRFMASGEGS